MESSFLISDLSQEDIFRYPLSHSYRVKNDVSCFYMIKNVKTGMIYIGQTKAFYSRIRNHIYNSRGNKGLLIDRAMHGKIDDFRFYIISTFQEHEINFFTRKKISVIEQGLIIQFNSTAPNGYNEFICFK